MSSSYNYNNGPNYYNPYITQAQPQPRPYIYQPYQMAIQIQQPFQYVNDFKLEGTFFKIYLYWTYLMLVVGQMGLVLFVVILNAGGELGENFLTLVLSVLAILQSFRIIKAMSNNTIEARLTHALKAKLTMKWFLACFLVALYFAWNLKYQSTRDRTELQDKLADYMTGIYGISILVIHIVMNMIGCYKVANALETEAKIQGKGPEEEESCICCCIRCCNAIPCPDT